MGLDFHLIANFGALALIALAGPAVIFILFYRRGAL
ncbi:MAG: photosystem II reaction center protein Ycf12/Psb30 [Synechococcus sp.]